MPQTGFEQRNYSQQWTTFSEEATYTSALLAAESSITREVIGQGATGLDIHMYKIGTGSQHVFMVAQVHAAELSGRDALLSLIRDWTRSTDQSFQEYLEQVTLLVVPTARPDSQTSRDNANGVNVNRDHVQVTQGETQAIQRVITQYQPVLAVDVHEGRNISNEYATHKSLNPNTHTGIAGLSDELEQHVRGAIEGAGWTWEPYQGHNTTGPEYGSNNFALRHAVGLLLESERVSSGGNVVNAQRRYDTQVTALNAILEWHADNLQRTSTAANTSRQAAQSRVTELHLPDGTATSWPTTYPAPDGYRVLPSDQSALSTAAEVFGLPVPDSANVITARHSARWMLHYLCDQDSPQALVAGARYYQDSTPSVPPVAIPGVAGWVYQAGGVRYVARTAGGSFTVPDAGVLMLLPDNVLEDPSFETDYWFDQFDWVASRTFTPSSLARTGDQAMVISAGNLANLTFDTIDVEPDDSWRLSIWYRTEGSPTLDGTMLRFRDGSNVAVSLASSTDFEQVGEYTRAVVTFTVPEGISSLNAILRANFSTGSLIIDDVSLQEVGRGG